MTCVTPAQPRTVSAHRGDGRSQDAMRNLRDRMVRELETFLSHALTQPAERRCIELAPKGCGRLQPKV